MTATVVPYQAQQEAEITVSEATAYQQWVWNNPVSWIQTNLGLRLWSKQRAIARSVRKYRRTSCRSCHGVGKTVIAAAIGLWYLNALCPSKVVTTSATWEHLKDIYWATVSDLVRNAPYDVTMGGKLLDMKLEVIKGWGMYGLSPNKPESFGGYHSANGVLVIVDEASALTPDHESAINGIITTEKSRILYIGNPVIPEGPFFESFRKPSWHNIHISAYHSPNVIEDRAVIPGLSDKTWLQDQIDEWGEESSNFAIRVKGDFPESGEDILIQLAWIEDVRKLPAPAIDKESLRIGVDVARYGTDRTVLVVRDKYAVREIVTRHGQDTMATAGLAKSKIEEYGVDEKECYIDDVGVGGGVVDRLREQEIKVRAVNAADQADEPNKFSNKRAEMFWRMRMAMHPNTITRLSLCGRGDEYEKLGKECAVPHYGYASNGRMKLESKDEIKKRLKGVSPDMSDALALTYARRVSISSGITAM